jgi:hypothetical protein
MQMMKFMLSQNVSVLRETMKKTKTLSGVELPENLVDLMYETMSAQGGEPVQLVSVRDVMLSEIPLPFMPDRIDYKIGKGCCDEIVKCDGLFVPCSKQCDVDKCAKHLKTPTGFGNYWDRHAAWSKNELYCVVIPEKEVKGAIVKEKEIKEKSYGTYLHSKKLDSVAVTEELSKWGVSLQLDPSLFRAPAKPLKKSRGRKAEKKVASTESDDESEKSEESEKSGSEGEAEESQKSEGEISEDEEEKPKEIKKKPVKEPKVKAPKPPKEPKPPKAPKEPKAPKVKVPKVKEPEPEPDSDDDDDMTIAQMTMAQLAAKAKACGLESDDEEEPIVVEEPEPKEPIVVEEQEEPTTVESDDELEQPSDDEEDLSMLSKAKKPEPKKEEPKPEPKAEKKRSSSPKTEKAEKPKTEKSKEKKRSSSPGELKKEDMEKKPKKGATYKGKKETLSEVVYDDETFLYKDGRYYNPDSLELLAWDNKGEFELL